MQLVCDSAIHSQIFLQTRDENATRVVGGKAYGKPVAKSRAALGSLSSNLITRDPLHKESKASALVIEWELRLTIHIPMCMSLLEVCDCEASAPNTQACPQS